MRDYWRKYGEAQFISRTRAPSELLRTGTPANQSSGALLLIWTGGSSTSLGSETKVGRILPLST